MKKRNITIQIKVIRKKINKKNLESSSSSQQQQQDNEQYQLPQPKRKKKLLLEEDRILRDAGKHPMLSPCNDKCKVCKQRIPDNMRKEIHDGFWTQNYNDLRSWIRSKVSQHPPKRERPNKKGDINRMSRVCHFNGEAVVYVNYSSSVHLGF